MTSKQTVQVAFGAGCLTMRKPDSTLLTSALPDLSQEHKLLEHVAWLAIPPSPSPQPENEEVMCES